MNGLTVSDLKVICAWCNALIRAPQRHVCDAGGGAPESHGVCRTCAVGMGLPPHLICE